MEGHEEDCEEPWEELGSDEIGEASPEGCLTNC